MNSALSLTFWYLVDVSGNCEYFLYVVTCVYDLKSNNFSIFFSNRTRATNKKEIFISACLLYILFLFFLNKKKFFISSDSFLLEKSCLQVFKHTTAAAQENKI